MYVCTYVCMQHFLLRLVYPPDNQRRMEVLHTTYEKVDEIVLFSVLF
jgi:hypothetical protein